MEPVPPLIPGSNLTYAIESQLLVNTDVIIVNNYQNNQINSNYIKVDDTILTNNSIIGLIDPVSNYDIVTKNYIDNFVISNLPGNDSEIFFNSNGVLKTNENLYFTTSSNTLFTPNLISTEINSNELTINYTTNGSFTLQGTTTSFSLTLPLELGQPLQVLVSDSSGNLSFVSNQTPGSPNFSIQFSNGNNGFEGDSSFTFNNNILNISSIDSSLLISNNLTTNKLELTENNFQININGNQSFTTIVFSSNIGTTGFVVGSDGNKIEYYSENSNTIGGINNSILYLGSGGFTGMTLEGTYITSLSNIINDSDSNYVFISGNSGNSQTIDVTDKTNPIVSETLSYGSGSVLVNEVINSDDILFLINQTNDLYILNVNNKSSSVLIGSLNDPNITSEKYGTAYQNGILYCNGSNIFTKIDVTTLSSPSILFTTSINNTGKLLVSGNYAYITSSSGSSLDIYNISSGLTNESTMLFSSIFTDNLAKNNDVLYLSTTTEIYSIDVSTPSSPTTLSFSNVPTQMILNNIGNNLYASFNSYFYIFDITNPLSFTTIFEQTIISSSGFFTVSDLENYVYVLGNNLSVYSLTGSSSNFDGNNNILTNYFNSKITQNNGITFKNLNNITSLNDARYLFVNGLYTYVVNSTASKIYVYESLNQLNIIDTLIENFKTLIVNNGILYILTKRFLKVYNLSDSLNPTLIFNIDLIVYGPSNIILDLDAIDLTIVGNFIYILFEQQPYINIYQILKTNSIINEIIYVSNKTDFPTNTNKITNDLINDPIHLYANNNTILTIFDITTPTNLITVITNTISSNPIIKIIPDYPYLYCLDDFTLTNYSILDYNSPTTLSSLSFTDAIDIYNNGNGMYVIDNVYSNVSLIVIDVQNILSPTTISDTKIGNSNSYLFFNNNILFTLFSSRFVLYDASNSLYPYQISEYSFISNPLNLTVSGEYAYITNYLTNKVLKYSLTSFNNNEKEPINSIIMNGLGPQDISFQLATFNNLNGSFLIYGNVFNYLNIVYNEKNELNQILSTNIDEEYITGLHSLNGNIYLSGLDLDGLIQTPKLYVYSLGNNLIELNKISLTTYVGSYFNPPFAYKNFLYVCAFNRILIYDNVDPQNLVLVGNYVSSDFLTPDNNIIVSGSYLYLISLTEGFFKFNINNPLNPVLISNTTITTGSNYCNIINSGKYLYSGGSLGISSLLIETGIEKGQINSEGTSYIALSGSKMYATNDIDNSFKEIDINGINCLNLITDNILTSYLDTSQINCDIINTDSMSIKNLLCETVSVNHFSLTVPDYTTTTLTINSSSFSIIVTDATLSSNSFVVFTINNYKINENRKIIYDINFCSISTPPILTIQSIMTGSFEFQIYTVSTLSGGLNVNFLIV